MYRKPLKGLHAMVCAAFAAAALTCGVQVGALPVYTHENPPEAPEPEDLPLKEEVTRYGITWSFEEPVRVGRFVGGDYYVVGPVTVQSVTPPATGAGETFRNGSMLNPPVDGVTAYDGRFVNIREAHLARGAEFPLRMEPGDSLVSSISLEERSRNEVLHGPHRDRPARSPLKTMAVLTCLEEPVPGDAFRPGYADIGNNHIHLARGIEWERLLRLELPESAPAMEETARMFERPWIDHVRGWASRDIHAVQNMPGYGREVGRAVSIGALRLFGDEPEEQKTALLYGMIQVGIDNWAVAERGGGWPAQGGFGNGRKLPIVLAAVMLQDQRMLDIAANAPEAVFGEDQHTEWGDAWTGAKVRFTGQYPEAYESNPDRYPDRGPYEHLEPAEWPGERPTMSESYRRCCTSISWVGQALAIRLLGAEDVWDHDAFFAYVDRWMTEDDGPFVAQIREQLDWDPGIRQGSTVFDRFVDDMWETYRDTVDPPAGETWR